MNKKKYTECEISLEKLCLLIAYFIINFLMQSILITPFMISDTKLIFKHTPSSHVTFDIFVIAEGGEMVELLPPMKATSWQNR